MTTATMQARVAASLDPLTGTPLVTVGKIVWKDGVCRDETGHEVALDGDGRWIYAAEVNPGPYRSEGAYWFDMDDTTHGPFNSEDAAEDAFDAALYAAEASR